MLKRERVHPRRYRTRDEARADLLDYLERFHNPRMRRRVARQDRQFSALPQPPVEMGWNPAPVPSRATEITENNRPDHSPVAGTASVKKR